LEQEELDHMYMNSIYRELENFGMGIKQLKVLLHTVTEIAAANNIPQDNATEKFFSGVQKQYDDKLGFESELQNLRSEVEKTKRMLHELTDKTAELNSTILKQIDQMQQVSGIVEFVPLVKAAGEKIPRNILKPAVIKAIDIMINSDSTGSRTSTRSLETSKRLLTNEIPDITI
jgi:hypothetical protein